MTAVFFSILTHTVMPLYTPALHLAPMSDKGAVVSLSLDASLPAVDFCKLPDADVSSVYVTITIGNKFIIIHIEYRFRNDY